MHSHPPWYNQTIKLYNNTHYALPIPCWRSCVSTKLSTNILLEVQVIYTHTCYMLCWARHVFAYEYLFLFISNYVSIISYQNESHYPVQWKIPYYNECLKYNNTMHEWKVIRTYDGYTVQNNEWMNLLAKGIDGATYCKLTDKVIWNWPWNEIL